MQFISSRMLSVFTNCRDIIHRLKSNMATQRSMIKLELEPGEASLSHVQGLEGIKGLNVDEDYGLICISQKRRLYTIRIIGNVDRHTLMAVQSRVKGVYGEIQISQIKKGNDNDP